MLTLLYHIELWETKSKVAFWAEATTENTTIEGDETTEEAKPETEVGAGRLDARYRFQPRGKSRHRPKWDGVFPSGKQSEPYLRSRRAPSRKLKLGRRRGKRSTERGFHQGDDYVISGIFRYQPSISASVSVLEFD